MPPNKGSISAGTAQKPLPSFRGRMDRARYWRQNHRNHGTGKGEDQFDKIREGERPLQKKYLEPDREVEKMAKGD